MTSCPPLSPWLSWGSDFWTLGDRGPQSWSAGGVGGRSLVWLKDTQRWMKSLGEGRKRISKSPFNQVLESLCCIDRRRQLTILSASVSRTYKLQPQLSILLWQHLLQCGRKSCSLWRAGAVSALIWQKYDERSVFENMQKKNKNNNI